VLYQLSYVGGVPTSLAPGFAGRARPS
jgi:hypothetical protein